MGRADADAYNSYTKNPGSPRSGCSCDYCCCRVNFEGEYDRATGGKIRSLPDGLVQIEPGDGGPYYLTRPGCLVMAKAPGPMYVPGAPFATAIQSKTVRATSVGHNCKRCSMRNDYAESNQPDGTYVCYECR